MMNYLSVCSGVEAASQAWHALGWNPVAFSEIEPFPCAVLASRFPQVPNLGDMCKIHYNRETKELYNDTTRLVCPGGIDLLVGRTPCQSFSFAGRREGLKGASGLAYHFVRLLGEIKPRWFVWENVPGALSSVTDGQRDFNFLVRQYAECGYDIEWRVLDTQYVRTPRFPRAIPQRRRRVFVVGHHSAAGSSGCQVLLEQEGLRGYPPPRRVKGKGFAKTADGCLELAGEPVALRGNRNESARGKLPETDEGGAAYTVTGVQTDSMLCVKETHYSDVISIQDMVRTNKRQNGCGYSQSGASYTCDSISMQGVACRIDPISSAKGVDCYNQSLTGDVSMTIACAAATDKNHIGAVAIGIGRDAFNSGKNAKMDMSISQDVMPPQTARGGGGQ